MDFIFDKGVQSCSFQRPFQSLNFKIKPPSSCLFGPLISQKIMVFFLKPNHQTKNGRSYFPWKWPGLDNIIICYSRFVYVRQSIFELFYLLWCFVITFLQLSLSFQPNNITWEMCEICSECGVVVVFLSLTLNICHTLFYSVSNGDFEQVNFSWGNCSVQVFEVLVRQCSKFMWRKHLLHECSFMKNSPNFLLHEHKV